MTEPQRAETASGTRVVRSLGVEREGVPAFFEYEEGPLSEGHARLETLYTGLSAGTELTFLKGSNPYLHATWDDRFGVFRAGEPSASYPVRFLGYMEVGRVTESRTPALAPGQVVAMTYGHKSGHTVNPVEEFWLPLPADLDPILGIYIAQMGPICANGLLHAAAEVMGATVRDLGDGVRDRSVLVTGGGVVGLITGLFALHYGASEVILMDPTPARRAAAEGLGMTALDDTQVEVWRWCKERFHHGPGDRGVDVAFQCRGASASLHTALQSLRPQGTVIDLAFYQGGATDVRLGEEFHHNGLAIRCAQIGRVPRGLGWAWDRARLARATLELLRAHGPAVRHHLITDVVPFDDAPALVERIATRQHHSIQTVFQVTP